MSPHCIAFLGECESIIAYPYGREHDPLGMFENVAIANGGRSCITICVYLLILFYATIQRPNFLPPSRLMRLASLN